MTSRSLAPVAALAASVALAACGGGSDAPPPVPHLAGTVAGLAGSGLVLEAAGQRLPVAASGAFSFGALVAAGQPFTVRVAVQPSCPGQTCTVTGGSGTMPATGDTAVAVTCATNVRTRLVTGNWGDDGDPTFRQTLRITDDFQALAGGATASPRVVRGAATGLGFLASTDMLAVDGVRGLAYLVDEASHAVVRFDGLDGLAGDVAPSWTHLFPAGAEIQTPGALALDVARDRLYVSVARYVDPVLTQELQVFEPASAASPALVARIELAGADDVWGLDLDARNDRLWVARWSGRAVERFDGASALAPGATAARTLTFSSLRPAAVAVDACHDRLYVGSHVATAGGATLLGFDGAGALPTGLIDEDAAAAVSFGVPQAVAIHLDDQGRLYALGDSASEVHVFAGAAERTGAVPGTEALSVSGAVASGYGIATQTMP